MTLSIQTIGGSSDRTQDGVFIMGCPTCDSEIRQKNLTFRKIGGSDTCENCKDWLSSPIEKVNLPSGENETDVVTELGACGCGNPDLVDDAMFSYLNAMKTYWDEVHIKPLGTFNTESPHFPFGIDESFAYLLAYVADMLGWTEHGGSVGGAWLTDDGKEALAVLTDRRISNG